MDDFEPFLQIVHISDLHVVDGGSQDGAAIRAWVRTLGGLSTGLANWIADGTAPHDRLAVPLFKTFLEEIAVNDPVWASCNTWLVDTGDLTSLGDHKSLNLGQSHLKEFAQVCPALASIYGNHDAWPGTLPLVASGLAIRSQGKVLAAQQYQVATPQCPLRMAIPHGGGEVQLYMLDSVIHDRWRNTWAQGEIPDAQLLALQNLVDQNSPHKHNLRILAVHHPVHYPPYRPSLQMVLRNDRDVAAVLDTPTPGRAHPLIHLVLSGHTHSFYPPHNALPSQPSLCAHPHLGIDQCQFVVGTLMQLDRYNKRLGWPHQCQVLRLYYSNSNPSVVCMERLLAARQTGERYRGTGIGPYRFVPLRPDGPNVAEEIDFPV